MVVNKVTVAPDYTGDVVLNLRQDTDGVSVILEVVNKADGLPGDENGVPGTPGAPAWFGSLLRFAPGGGHCDATRYVIISDTLGFERDGEKLKIG